MKAKHLVYCLVFLLMGQTSAYAQQQVPPLTPRQTQNLSRDLTDFSSQDFFEQGQNVLEREIELLRKRQRYSSEPILKIYPRTEVEQNYRPDGDKPNPDSKN